MTNPNAFSVSEIYTTQMGATIFGNFRDVPDQGQTILNRTRLAKTSGRHIDGTLGAGIRKLAAISVC